MVCFDLFFFEVGGEALISCWKNRERLFGTLVFFWSLGALLGVVLTSLFWTVVFWGGNWLWERPGRAGVGKAGRESVGEVYWTGGECLL